VNTVVGMIIVKSRTAIPQVYYGNSLYASFCKCLCYFVHVLQSLSRNQRLLNFITNHALVNNTGLKEVNV
jgi:hypothetical protein